MLLKKMSVNLNAKNVALFYGYFQYLLLKNLWLILRAISITQCVCSPKENYQANINFRVKLQKFRENPPNFITEYLFLQTLKTG